MAVENIGRKDLVWSLLATFFKIGAGVLLFPLILKALPSEAVGIWTIFTSITTIVLLFDFGFNVSFARNISYIFSGVQGLKKLGFESVKDANIAEIDASLLKNTIRAMHHFYSRMAIALFVVFITLGSYYIYTVAQDYQGDKIEVYISWLVVCLVSCYNLYTQYFESLLNGQGLVKRANQIVLIGNVLYITLASVLILFDFGLLAVVSSQALSVIVVRILSYRSFFTPQLRAKLSDAQEGDYMQVLKAISPNAVKMGLTTLGGFIITRASVFIGSLYVSLEEMASYGITLQLVIVICSISTIYSRVYMPKVFQWRVENNMQAIKRTFYISTAILISVFVGSGLVIALCGNWALSLMSSNTYLVSNIIFIMIMLQYGLETNHANAAQFIMSKNEVPFFKASLWSAAATLVLLIIFVVILRWGLWGMVLAPTLAQLVYQNWKWPLVVIKELKGI
ncbi:MAG: O-unit flippase-like protein [bacterium]